MAPLAIYVIALVKMRSGFTLRGEDRVLLTPCPRFLGPVHTLRR